ncbi:hypothetical protein NE237_000763 [Protea cynaroides]|uniref:ADP-ribosyl cyclase/cyclic ADP-ribose hydrolase n=1 Tax=Protea cynaroides TaxID=273540 RepID=A0A9Q0QXS3_9MAGN|nr:hypothetical protein NE237_000763 [Protea cynaroides]
MTTLDWASTASASVSTTFTTGFSSCHVFLSFTEDTRYSFTCLLDLVLKDRGIKVFMDSKKLWLGEAVGSALLRAIEGSKISIPIFSERYAHSKWCLLELVQIFECYKSKGQTVIPIFFHVTPSDVQSQTGSFAAAFQNHVNNFEPGLVKSWRDALRVIGNLEGSIIGPKV